jgi:hypothetical protein
MARKKNAAKAAVTTAPATVSAPADKEATPKTRNLRVAPSQYAGKTLVPLIKVMGETKRQGGSTRYKALETILKAGSKGLTFEEYKAAGHPARYVTWFIGRKSISIK